MKLSLVTKNALQSYCWDSFIKTLELSHSSFLKTTFTLLRNNADRIIGEVLFSFIELQPVQHGISESDIRDLICTNWVREVANISMNDGVPCEKFVPKRKVLTLSAAKKMNAHYELIEYYIYLVQRIKTLLAQPNEMKALSLYAKYKLEVLTNIKEAKSIDLLQKILELVESTSCFYVEQLINLLGFVFKAQNESLLIFDVSMRASKLFQESVMSDTHQQIHRGIIECLKIVPKAEHDDDKIRQFRDRVKKTGLDNFRQCRNEQYKLYLYWSDSRQQKIKKLCEASKK